MVESDEAVSSRPATAQRISPHLRDHFVAYRRSAAELAAWMQVGTRDPRSNQHEAILQTQHQAALKLLLEAPSASVGDLALKLQVIKDE